MNAKWIKRSAIAVVLAAGSLSTQAGPILQGLQMNGPILQGVVLNGPILQGLTLNGPLLQGPSLNGPMLQGALLHGFAASDMPVAYGRGQGVYAVPAAAAHHAVPGHSALSGIASNNVRVRLAN